MIEKPVLNYFDNFIRSETGNTRQLGVVLLKIFATSRTSYYCKEYKDKTIYTPPMQYTSFIIFDNRIVESEHHKHVNQHVLSKTKS